MTQIVLKDSLDQDVVFKHISTSQNKIVFEAAGDSLLDRKRLELSLSQSANVNRAKYKITVPSICNDGDSCVPKIAYTQVASGDVSIVRYSSVKDREDLAAYMESLAQSQALKDIIIDGGLPV